MMTTMMISKLSSSERCVFELGRNSNRGNSFLIVRVRLQITAPESKHSVLYAHQLESGINVC
jgi:hypothetical protein